PSALLRLTAPAPPSLSPHSLHDALPISEPGPLPRVAAGRLKAAKGSASRGATCPPFRAPRELACGAPPIPFPGKSAAERRKRVRDRKSTRLNSSHGSISYAVFRLKKKTQHPHCFTALLPHRARARWEHHQPPVPPPGRADPPPRRGELAPARATAPRAPRAPRPPA